MISSDRRWDERSVKEPEVARCNIFLSEEEEEVETEDAAPTPAADSIVVVEAWRDASSSATLLEGRSRLAALLPRIADIPPPTCRDFRLSSAKGGAVSACAGGLVCVCV